MKALIAMMVLAPCVARADIYQCGDKWSTKPCDGASKILPTEPRTPEEEKEKFLRYVRRECMPLYGVQGALSELGTFCRNPDVSFDSCVASYNATLKPKVDEHTAKREEVRAERARQQIAAMAAMMSRQEEQEKERKRELERQEDLNLRRQEVQLLQELNSR